MMTGAGGLAELLADGSIGHADAEVTLEDPAMILYTSGTTGKPKGAVLTHGNLTWSALNAVVDYDIVSTDVALMISPLFHAAALGMGALPIIMKGGTMILEKRFEPGRALALIQHHSVTMLSGVPTTYQMLCDHPDWDATDVSTMRKLTCGGSAVPTRVLNAYEDRGLSFSQGYGITETAPARPRSPRRGPGTSRAASACRTSSPMCASRANTGGWSRAGRSARSRSPARMSRRVPRPPRGDGEGVHGGRLVPLRRSRLSGCRRVSAHLGPS